MSTGFISASFSKGLHIPLSPGVPTLVCECSCPGQQQQSCVLRVKKPQVQTPRMGCGLVNTFPSHLSRGLWRGWLQRRHLRHLLQMKRWLCGARDPEPALGQSRASSALHPGCHPGTGAARRRPAVPTVD